MSSRITDRCTDETRCAAGADLFLEFNATKQWSAEFQRLQAKCIDHARQCRVQAGDAAPICHPRYVGAEAKNLLEG